MERRFAAMLDGERATEREGASAAPPNSSSPRPPSAAPSLMEEGDGKGERDSPNGG